VDRAFLIRQTGTSHLIPRSAHRLVFCHRILSEFEVGTTNPQYLHGLMKDNTHLFATARYTCLSSSDSFPFIIVYSFFIVFHYHKKRENAWQEVACTLVCAPTCRFLSPTNQFLTMVRQKSFNRKASTPLR
jgi:hypothetical protein